MMRVTALYVWSLCSAVVASGIASLGIFQQPTPLVWLTLLFAYLAIAQGISGVVTLFRPQRQFLMTAALLSAAELAVWALAHNGLHAGGLLIRQELLGVPDLYVPILEAVSAIGFASLAIGAWADAPSPLRRAGELLPSITIFTAVVYTLINLRMAQIVLAIIVLDGGIPKSFLTIVLPLCVLIALLLFSRASRRLAWTLLPIALVFPLLAWGGAVNASTSAWFSPAPPIGNARTIAYCWPHGSPRAMALWVPAAVNGHATPIVVYIHGGEGLLGSRSLQDGTPDGAYFSRLRDTLLQQGIAFASIDYGLFPMYRMGGQVQDAKCAVRFLRAHATDLAIDPRRIGVFGPSQGGYISAMLGTVGARDGYDVGEYLSESSSVQAVVDMWGPTDLTNFAGSPRWVSALARGAKPALLAASPLAHVEPRDPPFLIIHGRQDWMIAPHHSIALQKRLLAMHDSAKLVLIDNDGHGLVSPIEHKSENPAPDVVVNLIAHFFEQQLGTVPLAGATRERQNAK